MTLFEWTTVGEIPPLEVTEREHILCALALHKGNRVHTARALGVSLRCLRMKLKRYEADGHEVVPARHGGDWREF